MDKLKDSPSSTVIELDIPTSSGRKAMIFKRFRVTKWSDPLANLARLSPALRSWQNGFALADRGLATARPWLVLHRTRVGLKHEGYLLCEKIEDARELQSVVEEIKNVNERRFVIDLIARTLRAFHDLGLRHRDLKAPNLLVTGSGLHDWRCHFIDLVGVRIVRRLSHNSRCRDLMRLNVSFLDSKVISRSDRLRFLRTYLNWALHEGSQWKEWWNEIARQSRVKWARNRKRGRPLA